MFIVISMKTHAVLGWFAVEAEADSCHEANPPAHTIKDFDFSGLTNSDLVKIYNARPSAKPVARFADRKAAERRLREALAPIDNGVNIPPSAPVNAEAESTLPSTTTQETAPMAAKKKSRKKSATVGRPRTDGNARLVSLTAEGKKDKLGFHEGSPRSRIFDIVKKAESISVADIVKKAAGFAERGQVMGALGKLRASKFIKIEAAK